MNRQSILLKLKAWILMITILISFVSIYASVLIYNKGNSVPTVNNGRILTYSTKIKIEQSLIKGKKFYVKGNSFKSRFPYAVIDLEGKVLSSSIKEYKKNSVVRLNEFIEYDDKAALKKPSFIKYTSPLLKNNTQTGTVIFFIPRDKFLGTSTGFYNSIEIIPIVIVLIIIVVLLSIIYRFAKNDILIPISTLHESARKILKGDFSYNIKYDYDTEVGMFCHDFEAMRDELKVSKEKEVEIKANEKELIACLSHDIKTPLTAIHGYVSGIKDGIVKDHAGIQNYCSVILNRVKMLSKLLEDILEHSKAELNKMDIKFVEFYSEDFFKDILEDLEMEVESKGLKFIAPDNVPNLVLNADKKRISQVMYNLISNSIKYSREKGEIAVYFEDDYNYLKVYVKDTGIGISKGDVPFIFNKFYRAEKCRNQNIPGSGLGLSISKYIVEAHGGVIECIESSSNGTTMCFGLPK
jgi:signal transduction histidine kinase